MIIKYYVMQANNKKMEIHLFYQRIYEQKFIPLCQYLDVKRSHVSLGVPFSIQFFKGIFF